MGTTNAVVSFRQNVERMLNALTMLEHHEWVEDSRWRLKKLHHRLDALMLSSTPTLDPGVEVEFYTIIESRPELRQVSRLVFAEELVEICRDGLAYYAELRKKRPLTSGELEQLRSVEGEYQRAIEELRDLRKQFQKEVHFLKGPWKEA